jgi:sugar phosphate isomerase/epimerase
VRLRFFAAWWGRDGDGVEPMVEEVASSGYDGIETFVPADSRERQRLARAIERAGIACVAHQYEADGDDATCRRQLAENLRRAADLAPVLVNSHTGRDFWPAHRIDPLLDVAAEVEQELGVEVLHETHRSRFPYAAAVTAGYLARRPDLRLTADLSHWACVSETLLEDQSELLNAALRRTHHTHLRVGSAQSAQVSDPAHPRWRRELDAHVGWWRQIRDHRAAAGDDAMTLTCEIGPPPYMPIDDDTGAARSDFRAQNVWLREHVRACLETGGPGASVMGRADEAGGLMNREGR